MAFGASPPQRPDEVTVGAEVIEGEAFGRVSSLPLEEDAWPLFLGNAERGSYVQTVLPKTLQRRWSQAVAAPYHGPLAHAWLDRDRAVLTAPVSGYGLVLAAALEEGRVVALDARTGKIRWSFYSGARIDTPPTLHHGMALFGCHNGRVYALRASDGKLAWQRRLAPAEQRLVAFGQVESLWPVPGSVLAVEGTLYAAAGKTSENGGGLTLCALAADTGQPLWTRVVGSPFMRQNDLLVMKQDTLHLRHLAMDPHTGAGDIPATTQENKIALEGLADGTWTHQYSRRSGHLRFGRLEAQMLAWNPVTVFGVNNQRGNVCFAMNRTTAEAKGNPTPENCLWQVKATAGRQYAAMILCGDTLVVGGGKPVETTLAGYIELIDTHDGTVLANVALDAPPVYQGIAVLNHRLYVCLQNGTIVCLGQG